MATINILGLDELEKTLSALPPELARNALSKAGLAGGKVIAEEMSLEAPRGSGPKEKDHIADNIAVELEKNVQGSEIEVYIGPNKKVAYKARWQEFGTAAHAIATKRRKVLASPDAIFGTEVHHPGESPRPFMRTALQASGDAAVTAIADTLKEEIPKAVQKVKAK